MRRRSGLHGNCNAPPVDQCFADCDINTPGWANFLSCNSTDELRNLRALQTRGGNGENVLRTKALIPIPPKIVTNLAEILTSTKKPHAVLLKLIQVYQTFDEQMPSNTAKLSIHSTSILKLLWAKGTALTINFTRAQHQLATDFYTTCHNSLNTPTQAPEPPAQNYVAINQLVETLRVGQELAQQQSMAEAAAKALKSGFAVWTAKDWYLRAATTDKVNPAQQPTAPLKSILEHKNVVDDIQGLRLTAKTEVKCGILFPACIAVKLRQGILCGERGHITGLSLLLCIEHWYNSSFHNDDLEAMALQMRDGSNKLSADDSKSLTKEQEFLVYPTEIHQLQQGLLTYVQLLQLVLALR